MPEMCQGNQRFVVQASTYRPVADFITRAERAEIRFPGHYAVIAIRSAPGLSELHRLISHGYDEIPEESIGPLFARLRAVA